MECCGRRSSCKLWEELDLKATTLPLLVLVLTWMKSQEVTRARLLYWPLKR